MNTKSQLLGKMLFTLIMLALAFWAGPASAQSVSVTLAVVQVDSAGPDPAAGFVDIGVGQCANKAQGTYGCLHYAHGQSGPLNFMLQMSPGWHFEKIQIREPFANWGDLVPQNILGEFKEIGGPNHGNDFFDAHGEHGFTGNTMFFNIDDKNTPGNPFVVQYRVFVTDGTTTLIAHPIIDNEG